jgi:hypothetical protein
MENDFRTHGEHSAIDDDEPLPLRPLTAAFEAAEARVIDLCLKTLRNSDEINNLEAFARAAIRIEVAARELIGLMSTFTREEMDTFAQPGYVGPMQRNGIAVFIVPALKEDCGWRVVSPADAE